MAWTTRDSEELYGVADWGRGLFHVGANGHLHVTPKGPDKGAIDLHGLCQALDERGIDLPVLVRLPQVAERRLDLMARVFDQAISEHDYKGRYRAVYPLKVNPQRQLVEDLLRLGRRHHVGLEAGSKPELLVAMALLDDPDALIMCNGYKDRRYLETALMARKLGRRTIIVVEKLTELDAVLDVADEIGVAPVLGVRAKLSNPGTGRWSASAGDRAKFGLSAIGIMELVDRLRERERLDCLSLLHFHIGSQVSNIQTFKRALREATRLYVELTRLGAPMTSLDVGGGLGIDYDGSRTNFDSSRNYTESEYAADIIYQVGKGCDHAGVTHPDIITESGRATVAHCSVLLFDVLGVEAVPCQGPPLEMRDGDSALFKELRDVVEIINERTCQEAWHDITDIRSRTRQAFEMGVIDLPQMARVDTLFWQALGRLRQVTSAMKYVPEELQKLDQALADTYYANFSIFQSTPDAWAVDQLFPCLPIHRLDEEPKRRATVADLTCDSDGMLTRFVDRRDVKRVLELHATNPGERYVLAIALVGAYQEILGDLHNLFGDTNAVHLAVDDDGKTKFNLVVEGDTVEAAIGYVQYEKKELVNRIRRATERALADGLIKRQEAAAMISFYREGLSGYTYLGH